MFALSSVMYSSLRNFAKQDFYGFMQEMISMMNNVKDEVYPWRSYLFDSIRHAIIVIAIHSRLIYLPGRQF